MCVVADVSLKEMAEEIGKIPDGTMEIAKILDGGSADVRTEIAGSELPINPISRSKKSFAASEETLFKFRYCPSR
jgi:hypothetical protein